MKHIITDIQNRLSSEVPELKYIAQDWGQLDLFGDFPPLKFPAALIDITNATFSNAGRGVQEAQVTISVTIADLSNLISRNASQTMQDRAYRIFDIMKKVQKALHQWNGANDYAPLVREAMNRTVREDGARMRTLIYSTTWWDL